MNNGPHPRRWREALRRLGLSTVRSKVQQSNFPQSPESDLEGIVADRPHPSRRFVDTWYRDAVRRNHRLKHILRYIVACSVLLLIVAGVLAIVFDGL